MLSLCTRDRTVIIRHVRRGALVVESLGSARAVSSPSEAGTVARDALGIVGGAVDAITVHAACESTVGEITRDQGLTGFRLTVRGAVASFDTAGGPFEDVIARFLCAASPRPENLPREDPPFVLDARFSFDRLAVDPDPNALARELSDAIAAHLNASGIPARAWDRVIEVLRAHGHDLWSWDDLGDGAIWGSDYVTKRPGAGLMLTVSYRPFEESTVEAEFKARGD